MQKLEEKGKELFSKAGIKVNGNHSWDIQIHNPNFYSRVINKKSLGLGESYMDKWWDVKQLDEFMNKLLSANLNKKIKPDLIIHYLKAKIFNLQKKSLAFNIGKAHYDIGNDLYESMLDKRLIYTCGYWKNAKNLDEAQEAKLDLVCKKIGLKKGDKILDIGCGWGGFAKFASEKYKAKVVGITVSKEQVTLAKKLCKGLDVEIRLQDYRDVNEKFDHIISLGMFEHVGPKNYKEYFKIVRKNLKEDGLFLLHTIGNSVSVTKTDPWIDKYIFPNGVLPSMKQITDSSEDIFVIEDWHNFGADYDKTLMAWNKNFQNAWPKLKKNYDEKFKRMWEYYLLTSAGSFRARKIYLWQIIMSKNGVKNGYKSIR